MAIDGELKIWLARAKAYEHLAKLLSAEESSLKNEIEFLKEIDRNHIKEALVGSKGFDFFIGAQRVNIHDIDLGQMIERLKSEIEEIEKYKVNLHESLENLKNDDVFQFLFA
ncbi:MAG: hypothetical protein QF632_05755 [Candidatus Woesearchaeota archaeon]|nr:hypothetical protein [Candidatus Woesearchaeota archaeon]MDP7457137.1 hypothetical protein [Candidatus Woesearchaeota archaeon]